MTNRGNLADILDEYLKTLEAGSPPDRDALLANALAVLRPRVESVGAVPLRLGVLEGVRRDRIRRAAPHHLALGVGAAALPGADHGRLRLW